MNEEQFHIITRLLEKHIRNGLTSEKVQQLDQWVNLSEENRVLFIRMGNPASLQQEIKRYYAVHDRMRSALEHSIPELKTPIDLVISKQTHRIHFLKTAWFRYAAAIIIIFGISAYLWNLSRNPQKETVATINPAPVQNDILPGGNKAVLTLADGSKITLDSAANGQLAMQGNARILKDANGQVSYTIVKGKAVHETVKYNSMSTPKGGQYQLRLPDGTKVWLNAASSITYPTAFNGKERNVSIEGEAYFEVAKDASKPFKVKTWSDEIQVVGTEFNINSYKDEQYVKTSLLEGSVKIQDRILKPGEAYINGEMTTTDLSQDLAWKNGFFNFNNADLQTTMREFARWYDITVRFEGKIPEFDYQGELPKNLTLMQVLKVLNKIGVKYRIEEKTLIVSP